MLPEDVEGGPVEVWEECWPAVRLFNRLAGQWRMGANGPIGMDYGLALGLMDRMGLAPDEFDELLGDLQIMETAALDEMRKE